MTTLNLDREAWLTEAAQLIQDEIIRPKLPADYIIENNFRVSVGFPPNSRANGRHIACCIRAEASADSTNEIFISPIKDDSLEILAALTHELVHQSDNCESGHRNHFAKVARAIGLEGKFTQTYAGAVLESYFADMVRLLGDIPHAAINIDIAKPKQATRMLKVSCPECAFQFRTTQTQIERITVTECIACSIGTMQVETK